MNNYKAYSKYIIRSVNHIFKKFLHDESIEEVYETQALDNDPKVAVEIEGTIDGEIVINLPQDTLKLITKKFINKKDSKTISNSYGDVAGELANLITGTFANQLQYKEHNIRLSPPEFNDDPISIKAFYDNINISFNSSYGGFDVDFYYREGDD